MKANEKLELLQKQMELLSPVALEAIKQRDTGAYNYQNAIENLNRKFIETLDYTTTES